MDRKAVWLVTWRSGAAILGAYQVRGSFPMVWTHAAGSRCRCSMQIFVAIHIVPTGRAGSKEDSARNSAAGVNGYDFSGTCSGRSCGNGAARRPRAPLVTPLGPLRVGKCAAEPGVRGAALTGGVSADTARPAPCGSAPPTRPHGHRSPGHAPVSTSARSIPAARAIRAEAHRWRPARRARLRQRGDGDSERFGELRTPPSGSVVAASTET